MHITVVRPAMCGMQSCITSCSVQSAWEKQINTLYNASIPCEGSCTTTAGCDGNSVRLLYYTLAMPHTAPQPHKQNKYTITHCRRR